MNRTIPVAWVLSVMIAACSGSGGGTGGPGSGSSSGGGSGGGSGSSSGSSSGGSSGSSSGSGSGSGSSSGSGSGSSSGGGSGSSSGSGGSSGSSSGSGGTDGGFVCGSPADCGGGGNVCCFNVPLTGGMPPANCTNGTPDVACKPAASCPSTTSIPSTCSGTQTFRLCKATTDCTESAAAQCCTFSQNGGSISFCAGFPISLGGTCM